MPNGNNNQDIVGDETQPMTPDITQQGYRSDPSKKGYSQATFELERDVGIENSIYQKMLEDKNKEIEEAAQARVDEEEDKGFWGWLTTIGTTVGCLALGPNSMAACLAGGAAVGAATRGVVDFLGDAEEQMPGGIDTSGAKFNQNAWARVEGDVESQLAALEDFDDNVWKQDILAQASDTWTAFQWGTALDKVGVFDATSDMITGLKKPTVETALDDYLPEMPDMLKNPTDNS